jgi:hypothetical protein
MECVVELGCAELEAEQLERERTPIARGGGRLDIPTADKSMDAFCGYQTQRKSSKSQMSLVAPTTSVPRTSVIAGARAGRELGDGSAQGRSWLGKKL